MENIEAFNNHLPVKVRFGEGKALTLPAVVAEFSATNVFLMVDEGIEKFNPAAKAAMDNLIADKSLSCPQSRSSTHNERDIWTRDHSPTYW